MRLFTFVVSSVFVIIGISMISSGTPYGWSVTGFFGCCLFVAVFEPWLPKPHLDSAYRIVLTENEIACEHPRRSREAIAWLDVTRIWCVNMADDLRSSDQWLVFEGDDGGCSVPTDAVGFDRIWDELRQRFGDFDYKPLLRMDGTPAKQLCWGSDRAR